MNEESEIEVLYCEDCDKHFDSIAGFKSHFTRIHNIRLAEDHQHKVGEAYCPHEDCVGKPGFLNENKMAYHFQAKHCIKYQDWLCSKILKEKHAGIWPLCKCGCGEKVSFIRGDFSDFLKGHHHKGKNWDEEYCNKISEGVREWWKTVPNEIKTKRAIERTMKETTETRREAANNKYAEDPDCRRRVGEGVKKAFKDPIKKQHMLDGQARWLKKKGPNGLEKIVLNVLSEFIEPENIVFQFAIEGINHKFDFGIPSKNIVVECYGSYWHGDLSKYTSEQLEPWQHRNRAIDKKYEDYAIQKGYKVITIWENKKDDNEYLRKIISESL